MEEGEDSWQTTLVESCNRVYGVEILAIDALRRGDSARSVPDDYVATIWEELHAGIVKLRAKLSAKEKAREASGGDDDGSDRDSIRNELTEMIKVGTEVLFKLVKIAEIRFFRKSDLFNSLWSAVFGDGAIPSCSSIPGLSSGDDDSSDMSDNVQTLNLVGARNEVCMFCARCLQYIGDLQRYKTALYSHPSNARESQQCTASARACYSHARLLCPVQGSSYNQLALVDSQTGINLWGAYHYALSASALCPAEKSYDNLLLVLRKFVSRKHMPAPKTEKEKMLLLYSDVLSSVVLPSPPSIDFTAATKALHNVIVTFFSGPNPDSRSGKHSVEERLVTVLVVLAICAEKHTTENQERHSKALSLICVLGSALMQLEGASIPAPGCSKFTAASVALHILLMWFTNTPDSGRVAISKCSFEERNMLWTDAALLLNAMHATVNPSNPSLTDSNGRPPLSVLYEESELLGFAPTARRMSIVERESCGAQSDPEALPFSMRMKVITDRNVAFRVRVQAVYELAKAAAVINGASEVDGNLLFDSRRSLFTTKRPVTQPSKLMTMMMIVPSRGSSQEASSGSSGSSSVSGQQKPSTPSMSFPSSQPLSLQISSFGSGDNVQSKDEPEMVAFCSDSLLIPPPPPLPAAAAAAATVTLPSKRLHESQDDDDSERGGDDSHPHQKIEGFNPFWIREELVRTGSLSFMCT